MDCSGRLKWRRFCKSRHLQNSSFAKVLVPGPSTSLRHRDESYFAEMQMKGAFSLVLYTSTLAASALS